MVVRTESGGEHHYFAATEEWKHSLGSDKAGIGIDIQGVGKCVFGPGSQVAPDGAEYVFLTQPVHRNSLGRVPAIVIERGAAERAAQQAADRKAKSSTRTYASNPADGSAPGQAFARVAECWDNLAAHMDGGFNDALNELCYEVGRWAATKGMSVDEAQQYVIDSMATHPVIGEADAADLTTIGSTGIRNGLENPWEVNEEYRELDDLIAPPDPHEAPAVPTTAAGALLSVPDGFGKLPPRVQEHVRTLLARREAERFLREADGQQLGMPVFPTLTELLAEPDEAEAFLIDQVWPAGGRVFLTAQYKAGKTTAVANVIRSLVDGDPLFSRFPVSETTRDQRQRRVAVIDNEMSRGMLRRQLREQGVRNTDAVTLFDLRGRIGLLDLTDPARRAEWTGLLRGFDVVILDCLGPVLAALGLDENADLRVLLTPFSELVHQAGATEAMVVHHMGHASDRGRGHSSQRDWPDAEWLILRPGDDPSSPRHFRAFGRDVDVPTAELAFDADTRHLALLEKAAPADAETRAFEATKATLIRLDASFEGSAGWTRTQIARETRARKTNVYAVLDWMVGEGFIAATGETADAIVAGSVKEDKYDRFAMTEKARREWLRDPADLI
jgi:hypothetical protein